jgi:hypothetical protein
VRVLGWGAVLDSVEGAASVRALALAPVLELAGLERGRAAAAWVLAQVLAAGEAVLAPAQGLVRVALAEVDSGVAAELAGDLARVDLALVPALARAGQAQGQASAAV